jgi:hypothetical protein
VDEEPRPSRPKSKGRGEETKEGEVAWGTFFGVHDHSCLLWLSLQRFVHLSDAELHLVT